ncbi:tryptorubin family RiPP precursor [Streptomyces sp. NPDC048518]|uniref:tryptorubin family RiPP precursor n=1 Tax=Streptomyces sp. NPDC048518 TaxID=3155029 RepID=UPI0033FC24BF
MPVIAHHLVVYRLLIGDGDPPQVRVRHGRTETTGGMHMKVVRSLKKKVTGEKSLKSYAWYIWY